MSDITTLYLIRHGTTDYNVQMKFQGAVDRPLDETGLAQGALLADYFKDIPIDVAVVSPLVRTHQTMDCLLGDRKADYNYLVEPGIIEVDGGVLEGRPFSEINILWPSVMDSFKHQPGLCEMPGGETGKAVYERVVESLNRLVRENQGKTIVAVSHGFAISTWLNYVQGNSAEKMVEQTLDNVAVSKFSFDSNFSITVDYIGDSHHLPDSLRQNYDWDALTIPKPLFVCYPKCSTCKKARKFLEDHNIAYLERHIVEERLAKEELLTVMDRFDSEPRKFFNTSGMKYRELGLKDQVKTMDREAMATLLATDGMLVKRPQLILKDRVLVGFKETQWAEALGIDA